MNNTKDNQKLNIKVQKSMNMIVKHTNVMELLSLIIKNEEKLIKETKLF